MAMVVAPKTTELSSSVRVLNFASASWRDALRTARVVDVTRLLAEGAIFLDLV